MPDPGSNQPLAKRILDLVLTGGLALGLIAVYFFEKAPRDQKVAADGVDDKEVAKDDPAVDKEARKSPVRLASADNPTPPTGTPEVKSSTEIEVREVKRVLKIAVSEPRFDDVAILLESMGEGYRDYKQLDWAAIQNPAELNKYDILFLTCNLGENGPPLPNSAVSTIREFVQSGKTLYASDLWYDFLGKAFPEAAAVRKGKAIDGKAQDIIATVTDQSLQTAFGSNRLELHFDVGGWGPARFSGPEVKELVRGEFEDTTGGFHDERLLVKFPSGQGTVIFTSFHNSKLVSENAKKLLKALVVIVATAKIERETRKTAIKGGLSPRHDSLLTASRGGEPVKLTYQKVKRGPLRFVLGFDTRAGAILKLTVTGPDGKTIEKQGQEGIEIEIPEAAVGDWSYTISIIKVPYDNFGYQLFIAD